MTIVQLEYLLAVANFGSFSQAAERCFVTQPSLSMQIKNLEEELGVVLLDRSKKPVVLTQAGQAVVARARDAVRVFNSVYEDVAELKGTVSGVLRLGVIPTIAPYLLPCMVQDFARRCPDVHLEIKEMITPQIVRAMEHDEIDAAILAGGTCPEGISEDCVFDDRFFAYVSPEHRLYERANVRLEDLDLKEMLLLSEGHCFRDQILDLCPSRGAGHGSYYFESGSLETLMRIVDSTDFMTIIPAMAVPYVAQEHRSQVKPLAKGAVSRKIAIAVRRTYVKDLIVRKLRESVAAVAPKLEP